MARHNVKIQVEEIALMADTNFDGLINQVDINCVQSQLRSICNDNNQQ